MKTPLAAACLLLAPLAFSAGPSTPPPAMPGESRLLLPPVIPCLAGLETNLYFANALLETGPGLCFPDVTCAKGSQQNERWTWVPRAEDAGSHPLTLELRDSRNAVSARASTLLRVGLRAVGAAAEERSFLLVGDSLTAASLYSARILALAEEDGFPLRLVGSRGPGADEGKPPGANRHEGYGGWTAERFATHYTGKARRGPARECGSPFLYKTAPDDPEEKPRLDFSRYCQEFNRGAAPDFVTILLGCNDVFGATDETVEETIERFLRHTETLLAMVRDPGHRTRVGLVLPMPPAATQDAFGANYGSGQTRWQYYRNRHRVVERMTERFAGREGDLVFLVGAHLNLDPSHGFPATTAPAHARTERTVARQSNGVHPSEDGYRQIGDALYAWIRSFDAAAEPVPAASAPPRG